MAAGGSSTACRCARRTSAGHAQHPAGEAPAAHRRWLSPTRAGPDVQAFFALARMRFLGAPWVRRSEAAGVEPRRRHRRADGEVVASTISTENPSWATPRRPGCSGRPGPEGRRRGGIRAARSTSDRSGVMARQHRGRASAPRRISAFPAGPRTCCATGSCAPGARGRGRGGTTATSRPTSGWAATAGTSTSYADASTTTWEPEIAGRIWSGGGSSGRRIESRRLQGLPADSAARVACGGDTVSVAYVLCDGPYLVYIEDPAVNPPNLAQVQEIAAGIYRVGLTDPTDERRAVGGRHPAGGADLAGGQRGGARCPAGGVRRRRTCRSATCGRTGTSSRSGGSRATGPPAPCSWRAGVRARSLPAHVARAGRPDAGQIRPQQRGPAAAHRDRHPRAATSAVSVNRRLQLSYSTSIRRSRRGGTWWTQGLLDPLALSAALTRGRNVSELSRATSRSHQLTATYGLQPGPGGVTLNLGGLVDLLPGFVRKSDGGDALRRPFVNLAPTAFGLRAGSLAARAT